MPLSHLIGVDDAPFAHSHRGDVLVVGAVYSGARLEGGPPEARQAGHDLSLQEEQGTHKGCPYRIAEPIGVL